MQRREKENKILEKKIDSLIMVVSKLVLILVDEDDDDEDGPEFITVFTPIESKTLPKLIAQTKFLN